MEENKDNCSGCGKTLTQPPCNGCSSCAQCLCNSCPSCQTCIDSSRKAEQLEKANSSNKVTTRSKETKSPPPLPPPSPQQQPTPLPYETIPTPPPLPTIVSITIKLPPIGIGLLQPTSTTTSPDVPVSVPLSIEAPNTRNNPHSDTTVYSDNATISYVDSSPNDAIPQQTPSQYTAPRFAQINASDTKPAENNRSLEQQRSQGSSADGSGMSEPQTPYGNSSNNQYSTNLQVNQKEWNVPDSNISINGTVNSTEGNTSNAVMTDPDTARPQTIIQQTPEASPQQVNELTFASGNSQVSIVDINQNQTATNQDIIAGVDNSAVPDDSSELPGVTSSIEPVPATSASTSRNPTHTSKPNDQDLSTSSPNEKKKHLSKLKDHKRRQHRKLPVYIAPTEPITLKPNSYL